MYVLFQKFFNNLLEKSVGMLFMWINEFINDVDSWIYLVK